MAVARHGRHAAARGRHAAARGGGHRPQAVSGVLLGVTAGALGLVALLPSPGTAQDQRAAAPATVSSPTPVGRLTTLARASRSRVAPSPSAVPSSAVPSASPSPTPTPVDVLAGCTVGAAAATRYPNGLISTRALCVLPGHDGHRLRADAARAFAALDLAYRAHFGERLCVTDSYRSLSAQRTLARQKPRLAGRPGTSVHGDGLAVDLACGVDGFRTPQHRWLQANAGAYGWYQPSWAQRGGSKPEPWHWELRTP